MLITALASDTWRILVQKRSARGDRDAGGDAGTVNIDVDIAYIWTVSGQDSM